MLKTLRHHRARSLSNANRQWLNGRLDNIAQLVAEIRALPEGESAQELTRRLLAEAEDAHSRARYVAEFTAKASR